RHDRRLVPPAPRAGGRRRDRRKRQGGGMVIHAATDNEIHPPLFGGPQRSFGLYRGLARHHRVEALCVVPNRNRAPAEEKVAGLSIHRRKAWYTSAAWRLAQARLAPLFVAAWAHERRAADLARVFPSERADALLADLNLTGLFGAVATRARVYTSHNVELDRFGMGDSAPAGAAFWTRRLRGLERRAVLESDLTVVCSDEDAARMLELYAAPAAKLLVIPNGYDETAVRPPSPEERTMARRA